MNFSKPQDPCPYLQETLTPKFPKGGTLIPVKLHEQTAINFVCYPSSKLRSALKAFSASSYLSNVSLLG